MSMTTVPLASTRLMSNQFHHHIKPCTINSSSIHQSFFFNPLSHKNRSLRNLIFNGKRAQTDNYSKKCPMVKCHVSDHHFGSTWDFGINKSDLIYFGPSLSSSWKAWILGGFLIVQYLTNNVLLLLKLIESLELMVEKLEETVEDEKNLVEEVEKIGEKVEKEIDERVEAMTKAVDKVKKKINEIMEAVEKLGDEVEKKLDEKTEAVEKLRDEVEKKLDKIELQESIDKAGNVKKKVDAIIEAEVDKSSAAVKEDESTT